MASQKQLEGTRITRKGNPYPQVTAPPSKWWLEEDNVLQGQLFTPTITCSANLYRCIKRRVGRSLKRAQCKMNLVFSRKQAEYKLPGTVGGIFGPKRVPRPLLRQDSTCSNRLHHSGVIHKTRKEASGRAHFVPFCGES